VTVVIAGPITAASLAAERARLEATRATKAARLQAIPAEREQLEREGDPRALRLGPEAADLASAISGLVGRIAYLRGQELELANAENRARSGRLLTAARAKRASAVTARDLALIALARAQRSLAAACHEEAAVEASQGRPVESAVSAIITADVAGFLRHGLQRIEQWAWLPCSVAVERLALTGSDARRDIGVGLAETMVHQAMTDQRAAATNSVPEILGLAPW